MEKITINISNINDEKASKRVYNAIKEIFDKYPDTSVNLKLIKEGEIEIIFGDGGIELFIKSAFDLANKYNIENIQSLICGGNLKASEKSFSLCIVCDKVFMNSQNPDDEARRICPKCREIVLTLSKKLEGEK